MIAVVDGDFLKEHVGSVEVVEVKRPVKREAEGPVVEGGLTEDAAVVVSGLAYYWSDIEEHLHWHALRLALGQKEPGGETVDVLLVLELGTRLEGLNHAVIIFLGGLVVIGSEVKVIADDEVLTSFYCWEKEFMWIMRAKNNTTIESVFFLQVLLFTYSQ